MKIYGSEKALFDAASGAPSFLRMNSYGSENEAFFFAWSAAFEKNGSLLLGKVTSQDHFAAMLL